MMLTCPIPAAIREDLERFSMECHDSGLNFFFVPPPEITGRIYDALRLEGWRQQCEPIGGIYIDLKAGTMSCPSRPKPYPSSRSLKSVS